jgi:hypothetical protein
LGRITGLTDYDFATILHPSYEFLRSFNNAGGQFRGWYVDEESDEAALREAKLHGFPSPLPPTKADDGAVNCKQQSELIISLCGSRVVPGGSLNSGPAPETALEPPIWQKIADIVG